MMSEQRADKVTDIQMDLDILNQLRLIIEKLIILGKFPFSWVVLASHNALRETPLLPGAMVSTTQHHN